MRIIENWQFKFIEKSMYTYHAKAQSGKPTDVLMVIAIDNALEFFKGEPHEKLMTDFYFMVNGKNKADRNAVFRRVCDKFYISEPTGWNHRREIIYRVAMNCYDLGLFNNIKHF